MAAQPAEAPRFWSAKLGFDLGLWQGRVEDQDATWIRLFDRDGRMVPTDEERAEAERQRAEAERQRAEAAEAELARLRARLGEGE